MRLAAILCFVTIIYGAHTLKILGVFPIVSHSHHKIGYTLLRELSLRGHDVSIITPFPVEKEDGNLTRIVLNGFVEQFNIMIKEIKPMEFQSRPAIVNHLILESIGHKVLEDTVAHEKVQNLLKSKPKFDIVILEVFSFDGLMAIPVLLDAPFALVASIGPSTWFNHFSGNSDILSYMPNLMSEPPMHTTFCKRLENVLLYIMQKCISHFYSYPKQNAILQKYLPNSPPLSDFVYNASLMFFNSNPAFAKPISTLPNMIEIGGFHVQPPKKLPDDLQKILDEAKNGVIYFSMGSVIKSGDFSLKMREEILSVLSKLKETILWKFEDDLPNKPPNVIIRKWFPQTDVLAHPNVKLFITHGGLLSTIESLHRAVPVLGIPVFGDQRLNMVNSVSSGYGEMVPFTELTGETFSKALHEVLRNPRYSENIKRGSQILRNQLVDPIDKAEYWIKHVVEHKGALHLRPASLELTWYQHASLDVALFLLAITIILFIIFYKIFKKLLCRKKLKKQKIN